MDVVIIEDEPLTAIYLQNTLKEVDPAINVIRILDTVAGAVKYFKENESPDLIFMDIQLADGISLDIFKETKITSPVVFCTAYDEYAVHAFQSNGIDYLLKPFDHASIRRSLDKIKLLQQYFNQSSSARQSAVATVLSGNYTPAFRSRFLVAYQDKYLPVPVKDIACFYLSEGQTFVLTFSEMTYHLPERLEEIAAVLDPALFFRANRQCIINHYAVRHVENDHARKLLVKTIIKTPEPVRVSKGKASAFLEWMQR